MINPPSANSAVGALIADTRFTLLAGNSVIQNSLETALNSSGDLLFIATAEFKSWEKQGKSC